MDKVLTGNDIKELLKTIHREKIKPLIDTTPRALCGGKKKDEELCLNRLTPMIIMIGERNSNVVEFKLIGVYCEECRRLYPDEDK